MAPAFLNYFSRATASPPSTDADGGKAAVRALPGNWYTSPQMYELEKRAIFSRKWLLITHKLRFKQAGDWLRYEIAGYQFILCKDREGKVNGFHNVCRHRAFPVVTEEKGTSKIFACRYHGWSYGLNGRLAKAPGYQELEDFDKNINGLLPIHVHIDDKGFVWVNLDSNKQPEIPWNKDFEGADTQPRFEAYPWDEYDFDHSWEMEGDYNWKILADNYNECYHCATTHPDLPAVADLSSYAVTTQAAWIKHDAATTAEQRAAGLNVSSTYMFPNASFNVT